MEFLIDFPESCQKGGIDYMVLFILWNLSNVSIQLESRVMNLSLSKYNTKLLSQDNFSIHVKNKNNIKVILGKQFAMAPLSPLK